MRRGKKIGIIAAMLAGMMLAAPSVQAVEQPTGQPTSYTAPITSKTITQGNWSREDFSQAANPAIFTGPYTRGWYNAIRQSIVDDEVIFTGNNEKYFNPGYYYAHTQITDRQAFGQLLSQLTGYYSYGVGAEPYTRNQYEYPGYTIVKVYPSWMEDSVLEFVQPKLDEIADKSNREKVVALNAYLCELMQYERNTAAVKETIFADHTSPVLGRCSSYANAFSFLCGAAGIPCIIVTSEDHAWNEVYVDGEWLTVDVSSNDVSASKDRYLLTTSAPGIDKSPAATNFARELMVPGSTIK